MFEDQRQEDVSAFMQASNEFKKLLLRHKELDKVVTDAELGTRAIDDLTLAGMKKEKLKAKDRLNYLWEQRSTA